MVELLQALLQNSGVTFELIFSFFFFFLDRNCKISMLNYSPEYASSCGFREWYLHLCLYFPAFPVLGIARSIRLSECVFWLVHLGVTLRRCPSLQSDNTQTLTPLSLNRFRQALWKSLNHFHVIKWIKSCISAAPRTPAGLSMWIWERHVTGTTLVRQMKAFVWQSGSVWWREQRHLENGSDCFLVFVKNKKTTPKKYNSSLYQRSCVPAFWANSNW